MDFVQRMQHLAERISEEDIYKEKVKEKALQLPSTTFEYTGIDSLEDYVKQHSVEEYNFRTLISYFDYPFLYSEFGEDMVLYSWLYSNRDTAQVAQLTHRNENILKYASLMSWRINTSKVVSEVKDIYELAKDITDIDFNEILDSNIDQKQRGYYNMRAVITDYLRDDIVSCAYLLNPKTEEECLIPMDMPFGVALVYKDEPCAVTTFFPRGKQIMIHQVQGIVPHTSKDRKREISGNTHGLSQINWRNCLISAVEQVGLRYGFESVSIQSGHNNKWIKPYSRDEKIHLPLELALQKYDAVAERLGFSQGEDNDWYRKVGGRN